MKISNSDLAIIREQCERIAKANHARGRVRIECGIRVNVDSGAVGANLLAIGADSNWGNTDLHDYQSFADFRRADHAADASGNALFDFYLSDSRELVCNAQARFDAAGLVSVCEGSRIYWHR